MTIPCRVNPSATATEPLPEQHILVVDGNDDTCHSVCEMLKKLGIRPEWANNGSEAVSRVKDAQDSGDGFDTCFIDSALPNMTGFEAVKRISGSVNGDRPTFIITTYDRAETENETSGYEATRQKRALDDEKKANIPIVAVTANAFDEDRRLALEAGMIRTFVNQCPTVAFFRAALEKTAAI